MTQKIKVAWICHFSNENIRNHLPLSNNKFKNFFKNILGKKPYRYYDFAPWVTNQIKEFENFRDIELHIISPHRGLKRLKYDFQLNGIYYHFFKPDLPLLHFNWPSKTFINGKPHFRFNRYVVSKYIRKINPTLVNLIGTENPYYSITALDIDSYPVYISAQTVYTNPDRMKLSGECDMLRWNTELKIHKKHLYFGCGGRLHRDLIIKNNPNAIIFRNRFPIQWPTVALNNVNKLYDFVFFAHTITPKKGIEDSLKALAIVKRKHSNIKLNVVGSCTAEYKLKLQELVNNLDINDNVSFNDYFALHEDMFKHIIKSRFALLPVKLDIIPSTVREAMILELPVITYKTTGTPYLNKDGVTVLIAEIGDINKLSEHMSDLMNKPELGEKLKEDSKRFVLREYNNTESAKLLVKNYHAVINHFNQNDPIPEHLFFNINDFPSY